MFCLFTKVIYCFTVLKYSLIFTLYDILKTLNGFLFFRLQCYIDRTKYVNKICLHISVYFSSIDEVLQKYLRIHKVTYNQDENKNVDVCPVSTDGVKCTKCCF